GRPFILLSSTEIDKTLEKMKYGRSASLEQSGHTIVEAIKINVKNNAEINKQDTHKISVVHQFGYVHGVVADLYYREKRNLYKCWFIL
ncbi:hypothetical protein PanWU01x14_072180, partial [Parasponia andersonii]